jgi:transcriptional regulator with XRE-family HTH domain
MSSSNLPTGKQIKAARMLADLTQEELAEEAGVSKSTVENYETGRKRPIAATARQIIEALGRRGGALGFWAGMLHILCTQQR